MDFISEQLLDHVWHIHDTGGNGATLLVGENKALLFDTAGGIGNIKEFVSSLTEFPLIIVNSHAHFDHCGGNIFFEEAYMNREDLVLWEINKKNISIAEETKGWKLDNCRRSFESPIPIRDLKEGMRFELGGMTAIALSLKGHTAGSMGLYIPEKRLVLAGDAVSHQMTLFMDGAQSMADYRHTLKKLLDTDFDFYINSHFMKLYPKRLINTCLCATEKIGKRRGIDYDYPIIPCYHGKFYLYSIEDPDAGEPVAIIVNEKIEEEVKKTGNKEVPG